MSGFWKDLLPGLKAKAVPKRFVHRLWLHGLCFSQACWLNLPSLFILSNFPSLPTGTFRCTFCQTEVEEDESVCPDARTPVARFNEQIQPIYALLRETDDVNLSHDLLEPEPTEIPALKQRSVSDKSYRNTPLILLSQHNISLQEWHPWAVSLTTDLSSPLFTAIIALLHNVWCHNGFLGFWGSLLRFIQGYLHKWVTSRASLILISHKCFLTLWSQ